MVARKSLNSSVIESTAAAENGHAPSTRLSLNTRSAAAWWRKVSKKKTMSWMGVLKDEAYAAEFYNKTLSHDT